MSAVFADEQEILSGEAVAIDVQPVGFVMRALGALIDMVIAVLIFVSILLLQVWLGANGLLSEHTGRMLSIIGAVVAFVVYPLTIEMATRGRSVGKLAVGGRIVRVDGGSITFRHAFIRALLGVLEIYLTLGGAAVICGALTARSQRLGDLVAGTYSQRVRNPRLPIHAPQLPPSLAGWATVADVARMPDRLARRISQFLSTIDRLTPSARMSIAHELALEASDYVNPVPPVSPEELLRGITVLRRQREHRALTLTDDRAERLTGRSIRVTR